jgi:CopG family nickel-responsive transcriptional regulator
MRRKAEEEGVARVSFSLAPKLLSEFDKVCEAMGYEDRSKVLQMAIHDFITQSEISRQSEAEATGTILVLYNHERRGIDEALTSLGHEFPRLVISSLHIHLESENCLNIIAIRGQVKMILELEKSLRKLKGITQLKFSYIVTQREGEGVYQQHTHTHPHAELETA